MDRNEMAYCKHDLNVLFGNEIEKACDELVYMDDFFGNDYDSELVDNLLEIMLETKYNFNATKSELEDYKEKMKRQREYYRTKYPSELYFPECYSHDGKILYTENLFHTLEAGGFERIACLLGSYNCIALNGFDGSCIDFDYNYRYGSVLQIGKIVYDDEDYCCYFKGYPILGILEESWISDTESKSEGLRRADEEYKTLIEEEKKLAEFMASLGIYAIIEL